MPVNPEQVEVVQADRDAAVDFFRDDFAGDDEASFLVEMRAGKRDGHRIIQLLARHRIAAEAPLRHDLERVMARENELLNTRTPTLSGDDVGQVARDDWRCVNCKTVVSSATEPERCGVCRHRTFAHIGPSATAAPRRDDVLEEAAKKLERIEGLIGTQYAADFVRALKQDQREAD